MALAGLHPRTLFVIPSGSIAMRSHSVHYRFKPAAEFAYLCGQTIADSVLVIAGGEAHLLRPEQTDVTWGEQPVPSDDERIASGRLSVHPISELETLIESLAARFDRLALPIGRDRLTDQTALAQAQYQRHRRRRTSAPVSVVDSRTLIGGLRAVKDPFEVQALTEAARRSSSVLQRLLASTLTGRSERQVANWLEAGFLLEDMQWTSYETVVGSGVRSTILHARATDRVIKPGETVLVDAGAEWNGYCADITRVIPAGARFSAEQRQVYETVLRAQLAAISAVRPGVTLRDLSDRANEELLRGLADTGLDVARAPDALAQLMPHGISHWLGLDVHDPAPHFDDSGQPVRLKPGMVFTVEPGLYFPNSMQFGKYAGIGVRIEDDILVTDDGFRVLSSVSKSVEEIEGLRAGQPSPPRA
jgi:Xaa-Pro aminopeptidase